MFYIIATAIIGMNIAPFIFQKLDIWHAQGFWVQTCLALMVSWSFFQKPRNVPKSNVPLGLLHLWIAANVLFICFFGQIQRRFDTVHFFPYFNFLCILFLYRFIVLYLSKEQVIKIMGWMKTAIIFTLFVCVLQRFNVSQFFKLATTHHTHNNLVTGLLGNGTHLSGLLGMCSPLFFWRMRRVDILALVLTGLVLLYTGTTIGDPSISGFVIALLLFIFFYKKSPRLVATIILLIGTGFLFLYPHIPKIFFGMQSRPDLWKYFWPVVQAYFVTGIGLGGYALIRKMHNPYLTPNVLAGQATHLHFEFYEALLEIGIIGLTLILNVIRVFIWDKSENREQLVLKSIVIGFLLSCCFNFPAHLWMPSVIAMFSYAGFQVLKGAEDAEQSQRNQRPLYKHS